MITTKICEHCGATYARSPKDKGGWYFRKRRFCGPSCATLGGSPPKRPLAERFWEKVSIPEDRSKCWLWTAAKHTQFGYGAITVDARVRVSHRVAYELTNGQIPVGLNVLHRCDNPPCCNPDHLFLGTQEDNVADMHFKSRARGNDRQGEQRHQAKLREVDVAAIRADTKSAKELAAHYSVTTETIWNIRSRKTWKHI